MVLRIICCLLGLLLVSVSMADTGPTAIPKQAEHSYWTEPQDNTNEIIQIRKENEALKKKLQIYRSVGGPYQYYLAHKRRRDEIIGAVVIFLLGLFIGLAVGKRLGRKRIF